VHKTQVCCGHDLALQYVFCYDSSPCLRFFGLHRFTIHVCSTDRAFRFVRCSFLPERLIDPIAHTRDDYYGSPVWTHDIVTIAIIGTVDVCARLIVDWTRLCVGSSGVWLNVKSGCGRTSTTISLCLMYYNRPNRLTLSSPSKRISYCLHNVEYG
jgi:hypothetical protein